MGRLEDQLQNHVAHQRLEELVAAEEALADDVRDQANAQTPEATLSRLDAVSDYVRGLLTTVEPALVSQQTLAQVAAGLEQVAQLVATLPGDLSQVAQVDAQLDAVLVAAAPLAAATPLPQDLVRRVTPALGRALQSKARSLQRTTEKLGADLTSLDERRLEAERATTASDEERRQQLEAQASEVETAVELQQQRVEQLVPEFEAKFAEDQETRQQDFEERKASLEANIDELGKDLKARSETILGEVESRRADVEKLYRVITDTGTAGAFNENADAQEKEANKWRWIAFGLGLLTLGLAVGTVVASLLLKHFGTGPTVGGVLVSVAAGGLTAYTARQSGHHRDREEHYRQLELELTAFGPFVRDLSDPDEARKAYAGRLFRGNEQTLQIGRTRKDQVTLPQTIVEALLELVKTRS